MILPPTDQQLGEDYIQVVSDYSSKWDLQSIKRILDPLVKELLVMKLREKGFKEIHELKGTTILESLDRQVTVWWTDKDPYWVRFSFASQWTVRHGIPWWEERETFLRELFYEAEPPGA